MTKTTTTTIRESRLTPTSGSDAYQAGPEWIDTEMSDLRDWLDAAADNCPGIEVCPADEVPTIYGLSGATVYRWEDAELGGFNYTAVRED
jgi:hypothetical protein